MKALKILIFSFSNLIAIVLLSNCYTTGGEDPPPVAEISGVLQEPSEISPTDTAKFTVIIASQRLPNLTYSWSFGNTGDHLDGTLNQNSGFIDTDSTIIHWTPAGDSGLIYGTVTIRDEDKYFDIASTSFAIKFK